MVFTALVFTGMSQFTEERLQSLDAAQKALELTELSSRLVTPYLVMAGVIIVTGPLYQVFAAAGIATG